MKNTTFPSLPDLLFPHSCRGCGAIGEPICERCKKNIITKHVNYCPNCKRQNPSGRCRHCKKLPQTFVLGIRSELIGNLIHTFKYDSVRALKNPLGEMANSILPKFPGDTSIVPLPTIHQHQRERGFDHTLIIAKEIAKLYSKNCRVEKLLLRKQESVQVGASAKIRLAQADSAYRLNPKIPIDKNRTYILFDDVWTTGASMMAAVKKLQQAGVCRIVILILAVNRINQ